MSGIEEDGEGTRRMVVVDGLMCRLDARDVQEKVVGVSRDWRFLRCILGMKSGGNGEKQPYPKLGSMLGNSVIMLAINCFLMVDFVGILRTDFGPFHDTDRVRIDDGKLAGILLVLRLPSPQL